MKLSTLTKEPQLIELLIDDKDIVKEYGEALSFHTWDRQPMHIFTQLANMSQDNDGKQDIGGMLDLVRKLILDEEGKEIITDKASLPTNVLMSVIGKVTETLGK